MGDVPTALLRPFDLSNIPYTASTSAGIKARRAALGGQLFLDRLLAFAGVDGAELYPPSSPSGLRRLLSAIHESGVDRLKRDCFVYYLARDVDAANTTDKSDTNDNDNEMDVDASTPRSTPSSSPAPEARAAAAFARSRCLPRTWKTYMDGYWFLDHSEWERGVACLRDPCLPDVDFAREIVGALTTLVSPPAHALELVHAFLAPRAAAGKLASEEETDAALLATTSVAGMPAAFDVIRAMPEEAERAAAREAVWCWSLGAPRSPAGKGAHTAQPRALRELLHLALFDEEHAHLVALLAHPPRDITAPARSLLHDLVTLRLVHAGKYEETLALDKELAGTDAASAADRQRRREMVREFIDILPAAQRRILLGDRSESDGDVDMAASWVDVQREEEREKEKEREAEKEREEAAAATAAKTQQVAPPTPGAATPTPARLAAPTPIRAAPAFRNIQSSTPARTGTSSPFGGPPRFPASPAVAPSPRPSGSRSTSPSRGGMLTPARSAPSSPEHAHAVLPGTPGAAAIPLAAPAPASAIPPALRPSPPRANPSPFQPPASSSKPAPRKPKRVIDDTPRRSSRRQHVEEEEEEYHDRDTVMRAPSEAPIPEDEVAAPEPAPTPARRSRRTIVPPPPKEPKEDAPKRVTRGRASRASTIEPEHDDDPVLPGAFHPDPPVSTRGTRSAAKAALEEPEPAPETKRAKGKAPSSRRTTRAMSEMTDDGAAATPAPAPAPPPSRRTRRAAASAAAPPSDRGSPTPSVASSTAASPRRRRTARETRETSATPRATRSRKTKE